MAKRALDMALAGLVLLVTAPLWPVVALAIKLTSKGPVLHRAVRIGRDGKPFVLYKFRTMAVNDPASSPGITRGGDPRTTCVGRWMRASKIDELPNLINVLRGEMSLVGPRPEDPRYVERYTDRQRKVLAVRPGLTSPAAVAYRHEEALLASSSADLEEAYVNEVMPQKLELDIAYVERQSFFGDLRVLAATVGVLFTRPATVPRSPGDSGCPEPSDA